MGCSTWVQFWTLRLINFFSLCFLNENHQQIEFLPERFSALRFKSSATATEMCKESAEHVSCTLPDFPHTWELQKNHNDPGIIGQVPKSLCFELLVAAWSLCTSLHSQTESPTLLCDKILTKLCPIPS